MELIKKFIKNTTLLDVTIIIVVMLLFAYLFLFHCMGIFADIGRELILPQAILEGKVPYKDITLIYFPLSYYINALIYKLFGVSINSLVYWQLFICTCFSVVYYFLSREFLNRAMSLLATIMVIASCIFAPREIFSYIFPYSFARVYGIFGFWLMIFSLVKMYKTDNSKYGYLAAVSAGFSISCKVEYSLALVVLLIGLFLYKKLNLSQWLKALASFLIFPVITVGILLIQGVSVQNIIDAINYGISFSLTGVMTRHLKRAGMYPYDFINKTRAVANTFMYLVTYIALCVFGLKAYFKTKNYIPIVVIFLITWFYYYQDYIVLSFWIWLPFAVLILFIMKFKDMLKNEKTLFMLVLAALVLSQREFFNLSTLIYGVFSFPLLFLCFCVFVERRVPEFVFNLKSKYIIYSIFIIFIGMYFGNALRVRSKTTIPLRKGKQVLYVSYDIYKPVSSVIKYLRVQTEPDSKVLVLPEGNIINYFSDKKVDMRCFIMDALYHDAYGAKKAKEMVKQTNSDYVVMIEGFGTNNFGKKDLYTPKNSMLGAYIADNYEPVETYKSNTGKIIILKKKEAEEDN